jgi:hypothetical protein
MRPSRLFWLGLIIFTVSFFLVALGETSASPGTQPFFGFYCARFSFCYPWVEARDVLFHNVPPLFGPLAYASLLVSGWISPLFLLVVFLDLTDARPRLALILRMVILGMIPLAWFFAFYEIRAYPREGHFLWVLGMLFAMYPRAFSPGGPTSSH